MQSSQAFRLFFVVLSFCMAVFSSATAQSLYNEAPMLTERVERGELPPADERLPIVPVILQPVEKVGSYGGELTILRADVATPGVATIIGYEPLVRWDSQWIRPLNNLAQSIEVSDDATTFTMRLREGCVGRMVSLLPPMTCYLPSNPSF